MRNTTTQPTTFQYTVPTNPGDKFDIEFPEQVCSFLFGAGSDYLPYSKGGAVTKQFVIATKNSATSGLNSPTVNPAVRSYVYTLLKGQLWFLLLAKAICMVPRTPFAVCVLQKLPCGLFSCFLTGPAGSPPTLDSNFNTWFESAVVSVFYSLFVPKSTHRICIHSGAPMPMAPSHAHGLILTAVSPSIFWRLNKFIY